MGRNSSRAENERRSDLGGCPCKSHRRREEREWDPLPQEKREGINDSSWGREREPCQIGGHGRTLMSLKIKVVSTLFRPTKKRDGFVLEAGRGDGVKCSPVVVVLREKTNKRANSQQ